MSCALQSGYRLVDCAYCYGNEDEVGQGLRLAFDAGVERDRVFVMTKVWATYNTRVAEGLDKSLQSLGLGYVDLFLIVSRRPPPSVIPPPPRGLTPTCPALAYPAESPR